MIEANRLFIATEFKCLDCGLFKDIIQDTKYLEYLQYLPENKEFMETVLHDLEQHIKDKHLERYKAFIGDPTQRCV